MHKTIQIAEAVRHNISKS